MYRPFASLVFGIVRWWQRVKTCRKKIRCLTVMYFSMEEPFRKRSREKQKCKINLGLPNNAVSCFACVWLRGTSGEFVALQATIRIITSNLTAAKMLLSQAPPYGPSVQVFGRLPLLPHLPSRCANNRLCTSSCCFKSFVLQLRLERCKYHIWDL